ncbi:hypothetical protein EW145_g6477 [Phellinidium pouzarii]|uniref:CNH domain-containing protein n=1 Tax=Phellinidium pouzarii TaxID=167371 RepID=A0A4S4KWH2_9AGAM|nr:hypothetical protein EW145_g6477 [Phellinidium pouzarii]
MAFASVDPVDVPPYQLQELVSQVFENDVPDSGLAFEGTTSGDVKPHVTCAHALGSEIYLGCSDGTLLRYALLENIPNSPASYTLLSRQTLPTNKPIEEIALCPSIMRALIFSDHQVHFYIIPSLDPVHSSIIRPIRNVISLAVDEQHMRLPPLSEHNQKTEPIEFCVIKRTNISMYTLKERLVLQREVPNAMNIRYGRRNGRYLCAADSENYDMIDLAAATSISLLPFSQIPEESTRVKPLVSPISDEEFLILSNMGPSTMGVFVASNTGDPVRGTLEWPSYPESICLDYPYIAALLSNRTIEIHSIETQAVVQVISAPSTSEPRIILPSHAGYMVPSMQKTNKLRLVTFRLDDGIAGDQSPPPPPLPLPKSSSRPPLFPRSNTLVLSNNSVQALLPSTVISQAESLLESHRIDDAVELADQNQRKLLGSSITDDELADELRYVYQRIGFRCFSETLFEDAGRHLLAGETDPRLLVRYFPDLRGNLFRVAPNIDVFAGVVTHLPSTSSIDELVVANLVKNYAPHIKPDIESAPSTAELRRILCATARDMLTSYLRKYRTRRLLGRAGLQQSQSDPVNTVVDTVLAKILAENDKTSELYTLIDEPNNIAISEIEVSFEKNGQYNALCKLYIKCGDEEKLLETWSKLADGIWSDEHIKDPLVKMIDLLNKTTNRTLVQHWGLWLTQRDVDMGLKLIISRDARRSSKSEELALLGKIREVNAFAGVKYLEYLVLQKRIQDQDLHSQLVDVYVGQILEFISDETISKLWRAKASSYASSHNDTPFLMYFASTTPESDSRNLRLKTVFLLQGSVLYDVERVLERIQEHKNILRLEMAILYGKLGRHEEAISTLVRDIHDPSSAESYCTLGGDVIPGRVALTVGERCGLQRWAALVSGIAPALGLGPSGGSAVSTASLRTKVTDENTRRELLNVLLRVYMSGGESTMGRTSRLLNSQSVNLDVLDVMQHVPPDWPLSTMSSFLVRSFRRTVHARHEGQIIKAISAGQNLEVVDNTWHILREQGAIVEEAIDDDDGSDTGEEKFALDEKIGLHNDDDDEPSESIGIAEIRIDKRKPQELAADDVIDTGVNGRVMYLG